MKIRDPLAIKYFNENDFTVILSDIPYVEGSLVSVNNIATAKIVKSIKLTNNYKQVVLSRLVQFSGHRTVDEWVNTYKTRYRGEPRYAVIIAKPRKATRLMAELSNVLQFT